MAATHDQGSHRVRYPARAIVVVALSWLMFGFSLLIGALFVALMLPALPIFIGMILGGACLLGSAHEYARKLSIRVPLATLSGPQHEHPSRKRSLASHTP